MRITDIAAQKHNKDRVSVFVDNEYAFSLDGVDALKYQLKAGVEITQSEIEFYRRECNIAKARALAMDILSRKPVCKKMLLNKLTQKGFDKDISLEIAAELEDLGLIDDYAYGCLFAEYAKEKCWGARRFKYELTQKGVDIETINLILQEVEFSSIEEIVDLLKQKYPREDFSDFKVQQKANRFLASRGFDFSVISEAIGILKEGEQ